MSSAEEVGRGSGARRSRRLAALAVALAAALVSAAVIPILGWADPLAASSWRTFLVGDPGSLALPPPPERGSPEEQAELAELRTLQSERTPAQLEAVARWSNGAARWNEIFLNLVRKEKPNPVRTSRAMALLNTAIYDAVILACRAKASARRPAPASLDPGIVTISAADPVSPYPSIDAAIAGAAQEVLGYIFQGHTEEFAAAADEAQMARLWAGTNSRSDLAAGLTLGRNIAALAISRGKSDGSDAIWRGTIPTGPGYWAPAPAIVAAPIEPLAGTWRPWLLESGAELRPRPPPWLGSPEWQREADEVVAVTRDLTNEQVGIARFWNDGPGTDTPPGHWLSIGLELAARDRLSTTQTARVLAYVSVAAADAFISCWETKYHYWSGRPTGLISGFASTIITPNFPSYTSGHSIVSGATATVLSHFFPLEAGRLRAMAEEAAVSRLYGGIHYRVDNDVGLSVGRQIGARAIERARGDGAYR